MEEKDMLNISEIRINKINNLNKEGFLGYASILIDNCFVISKVLIESIVSPKKSKR